MGYLFGSHVSCQGGLLCGVDRAVEAGCNCLQIFVCQPRQWPAEKSCIPVEAKVTTKSKSSAKSGDKSKAASKAASKVASKPTASDSRDASNTSDAHSRLSEADLLERALHKNKFPAPIAHASYLINLGSSDETLWQKSLDALVIEWSRSEHLKLSGLVMHPGAHMACTEEAGLSNIVRGIEAALAIVKPKHCRLLLENTAGQGSCLGWRFEHLGWLIDRLDKHAHIGVCFDTCHAFAAGYDYSTPAKLKGMWNEFDQHVGVQRLYAIHLNDSKKELGSRVDRHEHIGQGAIGEKALTLFIKSAPVKHLPMILETEKGINEATGVDYDIENLQVLRRLVGER